MDYTVDIHGLNIEMLQELDSSGASYDIHETTGCNAITSQISTAAPTFSMKGLTL